MKARLKKDWNCELVVIMLTIFYSTSLFQYTLILNVEYKVKLTLFII